MKKKVLIVVDMQNDFIYGSLGNPQTLGVVYKVRDKTSRNIYDGNMVVFTADTHTDTYLNTLEGKMLPIEHCICGTEGWRIIPELEWFTELKGEDVQVIRKSTFGYEHWKTILETIDIEEIEIIGVCTDICVVSNALVLRMLYPNTKIVVDASCCAGTTEVRHKAAIETMKSCQIEIING